jgi:hypothetical protein
MLDSVRSVSVGGWLVGSIGLYILAANLSWRVQGWTEGRGQRLGVWARRLAGGPLPLAGALTYNIVVPYAALLVGRFDLRVAGLIGFDWSISLRQGAALAMATSVLLWLNSRHVRAFSAGGGREAVGGPVVARLWHALFVQAHLGFYRTICLLLFGSYAGVWVGLALVLAEWLLAPAWRAGWAQEEGQHSFAFDLALAITTTVLFLYTSNTWVCVLMHASLALVFPFPPYSASHARSAQTA